MNTDEEWFSSTDEECFLNTDEPGFDQFPTNFRPISDQFPTNFRPIDYKLFAPFFCGCFPTILRPFYDTFYNHFTTHFTTILRHILRPFYQYLWLFALAICSRRSSSSGVRCSRYCTLKYLPYFPPSSTDLLLPTSSDSYLSVLGSICHLLVAGLRFVLQLVAFMLVR